ncbi:hypothetical protein H7N15_003648 [Salmonella enterica]|nr:hypothetical protein [Salmonella enterica]
MKQFDGLQSLQQPLSGLPQWVSERILQQINQLTHYEPVIGIMGKTGAGKSSLCNALFAGDISPVSDVAACTRKPLQFRLQLGKRFMTIMDLPGVGESELRDAEYAALYREQLPRLDLVLWTAGLNGMSFDEAYEAVSGGQYWFITLLLNIALGYLDERRLRKAGVDTTTFGKLARLVPFYLWRRAKTLGQKPAYFWVWLVMLGLTVWA